MTPGTARANLLVQCCGNVKNYCPWKLMMGTNSQALLKRMDQEIKRRLDSVWQKVRKGHDFQKQQITDLHHHFATVISEDRERVLTAEVEIPISHRWLSFIQDALSIVDENVAALQIPTCQMKKQVTQVLENSNSLLTDPTKNSVLLAISCRLPGPKGQ